MNANAPNFGAMYVMLDEFHHRADEGLTGPVIAARLQDALQDEIKDGLVNVFEAPAGRRPGDRRRLQDRDRGPRRPGLAGDSRTSPTGSSPARRSRRIAQSLSGLFTSFRANTPWLYLDIDRDKAKLAGVSIAELFNTLQVYLGSLYVNDFNRFGRTWQVNVQGDANFRKQIDDLTGLQVRNDRGGMVPLGSVAAIRDVSGPVMIIRYNLYPVGHDQPESRPRASARARRSTPWRSWSSDELPQAMRIAVDRAGAACSSRPATRPCSPSSWRWCSSSWCWRRSTRAGRCRWP